MLPPGMDVTMELFCTLAVVNHQGGDIKFSRGSIVVGNMNAKSTSPKESFILVQETRYSLNGNIEHVSTEFLNQGHVTVCLKDPSCNIFITNAVPEKLTAFIAYFKEQLPADAPGHVSMAALGPPVCRINLYLGGQQNYKSCMENVIDMNINLDHFTDLKIDNCTLELAGYQLPIAGAIRNMKNLTTFRLGRIHLLSSTFLEIESKELNQLHLRHSETPLPIASLFKNDLCYKDSLVELSLEGNRWSEIPSGIFQFRNLLKLSLRINRNTELPDKFTNFPKLLELELSHNRLTRVPPSIFTLKKLSKLELDFNHITELPDMFAKLSKLRVLKLTHNQLSSVPPSIFQLQNLSKLYLIGNFITELPDIINLPKLNALKLGGNQLRHIPPNICSLQNLVVLSLRNNLLTALPDIINLPKLETLQLDNNQFRHVPSIIFQMQNLSELSLSRNHLTELPDKFISLPKLKYLSLDNNQLQYLPTSILLLHLTKLDIRNNASNFGFTPSVGSEPIVYSLKELSYRTILNHKLKVKEGMLPEKCLKDLENHRQCICGCKFVDEGQEASFSCYLNNILGEFACDYMDIHYNSRITIRGKMCTSLKSCSQGRFRRVN